MLERCIDRCAAGVPFVLDPCCFLGFDPPIDSGQSALFASMVLSPLASNGPTQFGHF
jgi:hypothetical protein